MQSNCIKVKALLQLCYVSNNDIFVMVCVRLLFSYKHHIIQNSSFYFSIPSYALETKTMIPKYQWLVKVLF